MAWDTTPWFVGGGAVHSPEVARLLAHAAFGGAEGIIAPSDLKVTALPVPGTSVRVLPGACSILARGSGGGQQAYAARNPTEDIVDIAATGSTSGRSDLIVARIEDPFMPGEPWADPADPATGQYIFTRVLNVPAGTTALPAGMSGIVLARIDIPANTGTITDAMIVDLRKVARPQRFRDVLTYAPGNKEFSIPAAQTTGAVKTSFRPVTLVPTWASDAVIRLDINNLSMAKGAVYGKVWLTATDGVTTLTTPTALYDMQNYNVNAGDILRVTVPLATTITIPAALRGKTVTWSIWGSSYGGAGITTELYSWTGSSIVFDYEFRESAR